ncbi:MAG: hypothetical protein ABSF53_21325 [Terracidiphilus sp.]
MKSVVTDEMARYYAGMDPRQMHFDFYLALGPRIEPQPGEQPDRRKKPPERRPRRAA